jgi:F-type H+-transporting ATPase subunit b
MLIDWFTVGAQIVNFLILVFLLKHFLYGRIIGAMDRREERIAARLNEAERKRTEAEEETGKFRKKNKEFDDRKNDMLSDARKQADDRRNELIEEARIEVDETRKQWQEAVLQEKSFFLQELKKRAGAEIYAIARKTLAELSESGLERQMITVFIKRLQELDKERNVRSESLGDSEDKVTVTSAFEIGEGDREKISGAVHRQIGKDAGLSWNVEPELISGIELRAGGKVVTWNLDSYLKSLEKEFGRLLEDELDGGKNDLEEREGEE